MLRLEKILLCTGLIIFLNILSGCKSMPTLDDIYLNQNYETQYYDTGVASFYGKNWVGKKTASGEKFNNDYLTAANKTLPFNTIVLVKDLETNKTVIVKINDRGPFAKGRIIDLSEAAAKKLGIYHKGTAKVSLYILIPKKF